MSKAAPWFEEIELDQWNPVMAALTRTFRGAHARLEVMGPEVGYQVETEDRPFEGIAADIKDHERIVWIQFDDLSHAVHRVEKVRIVPQTNDAGPVMEIEDQEGVKTVLTLGTVAEFALPPAKEGRKQNK